VIAARVHAFGSEPRLDDVAEPVPSDGESLVEVAVAPVGHLDLTVMTGTFVHRPPLPYVPGTDAAGRIVASATHPPGARVRIRGGGLGLVRDGTWQQRVAIPDSALHPVPDGVDLGLASLFFSPATTAHVALHEVGGLQTGERVAVTGAAGAVGSLAVQLALRGGASLVAGVVGRPGKAAAVPDGAEVVRPGEALPADIDLLVDTVGGPRLGELVGQLRRGGRVALVGYTAGTTVSLELPALLAADIRLLPVNMLVRADRVGPLAAELLELLASGGLQLPFEVRPLTALTTALDDVRNGRVVGRVALDPAR
jgi:NADPH:quinone reductase-like Zn-dependent oxidoreductase